MKKKRNEEHGEIKHDDITKSIETLNSRIIETGQKLEVLQDDKEEISRKWQKEIF